MPRRPASEMMEALKELADDLFGEDDGPDKDNYITQHMEKLGYKKRVIFDDADDDNGNDGGGSFTSSIFGNRQRERRDVPRGRDQRRASGGLGGYQ